MTRGGGSDATPSALRPGVILDEKYEIVTLLGAGGMGEVYKARHVHLGALRCIKVMKSGLLADESYRARFLREARLATQIHHPNIAVVHDFATLPDGGSYMVTEFINGITVRQWGIEHGAFPLALAAEIGVQVLSGLDYIHRRGLLHRDISADNIMLAYDDEERLLAKIIDLGVAKDVNAAASETTQVGMLIGNPKYMSPEQLGNLPEGEMLDGRADLYSFGIVLYEMLLGVPPFVSRTPSGYIVKHLTEPPMPFGDARPGMHWPNGLEGVIFRALEKERKKRYTDAREFAAALAAFLARPAGTMTKTEVDAAGRELEDTIVQFIQADVATQVEASVEEAFQRAWELGTVEVWQSFLDRYASSPHAARAQVHLDEARAFERAREVESETALREFLKVWPEGRHRLEAEIQLVAVKEKIIEAAFHAAVAADSYAAFRDFLARFGTSKRADEAKSALEERLAFETAAAIDSEEAWEEYLAKYADDPHAAAARERLVASGAREEEEYAAAAAAKTAEAWGNFLERFPSGRRRARADQNRREAVAFAEARAGGRAELEQFLRTHPNGLFAADARRALRQRAEEEEIAQARRLDTPAAWRLYLTSYPAGIHREEAMARVAALEDAAYNGVLASKSAARVREFLAQFPDSPRRPEIERLAAKWEESEAVRRALDALQRGDPAPAEALLGRPSVENRPEIEAALDAWRDERSWREAEAAATPAAVQAYLESRPEGRWAREAKKTLAKLRATFAAREESDWQAAWEKGTSAAWDEYLAFHSDSPKAGEASRCRQEAAEFEQAVAMNTTTMWRAFIKAWPDGRHRLDAEVRLRGA